LATSRASPFNDTVNRVNPHWPDRPFGAGPHRQPLIHGPQDDGFVSFLKLLPCNFQILRQIYIIIEKMNVVAGAHCVLRMICTLPALSPNVGAACLIASAMKLGARWP